MSARDVLVVAEIQRDTLDDITLELLAAARGLATATGGQVVCVVLSSDGTPFTAALSAADRIVLVNDPLLATFSPAPYLTALQQVVAAEQPRAVLVPGTSVGWDIAPLLAGSLQAPLVTGCSSVQLSGAALAANASFCGGKMMAEVQIDKSPAILLVMPGSCRPATQGGAGQVEIRALDRALGVRRRAIPGLGAARGGRRRYHAAKRPGGCRTGNPAGRQH